MENALTHAILEPELKIACVAIGKLRGKVVESEEVYSIAIKVAKDCEKVFTEFISRHPNCPLCSALLQKDMLL
jgi:hypothetical protein